MDDLALGHSQAMHYGDTFLPHATQHGLSRGCSCQGSLASL
jgi:hypothetical protein